LRQNNQGCGRKDHLAVEKNKLRQRIGATAARTRLR
jgi:hypothetical protein